MPNLSYHNIIIEKSDSSKEVVVKGEVSNHSDKSYATVAVRIVLFIRNVTVANMVFTINGLSSGATKAFKKTIDDLEYDQVGKDINRFDIYTETAF
ncbi:MAG: FxLYD domain-containing protein [Candidatus Omnitrophica bacterium]|nr:FxLYD domain-containing protein [Candidatus Omnitrophota bacterium]